MIDLTKYTEEALDRAREGALNWLQGAGEGFPHTIEAEQERHQITGLQPDYDFDALAILGYEKLVDEGLAVRGDVVSDPERGLINERREYRITEAGKQAECNEDAW